MPADRLDQKRVLGDREDVLADGLAVPAGDPREPMRDVLDLDVERGRVEEIESAAGQHALPGARGGLRHQSCRSRVKSASRAISKALKAEGFNFVGPTIVYAFMQAVGMVNDHLVPCFRHAEVKAMGERL